MAMKKVKKAMINITINLPDAYDNVIQSLIKANRMPSRSEAIRTALREFLNKELINFYNFSNIKVI